MEAGVRRLLLKNVQLEQAGEVSYQALNAVTSAMLNVKGERSRSPAVEPPPHVISCENKGVRSGGAGAIKLMSDLRSLLERFEVLQHAKHQKTPSSGRHVVVYISVLYCPTKLFVSPSAHWSVQSGC